MRIAVLANLKKNAPTWEGMAVDQWDDLDSPKTADAIVAALHTLGHEAVFMEASILPPHNLIERLLDYRPDLCFNIAESHFGDSRESQIPALLEMLRIPYTGSKLTSLAVALDKPMTKRILAYHGLPTPEFQVFTRADEPIHGELLNEDGELRFPLFIKPSAEGTTDDHTLFDGRASHEHHGGQADFLADPGPAGGRNCGIGAHHPHAAGWRGSGNSEDDLNTIYPYAIWSIQRARATLRKGPGGR